MSNRRGLEQRSNSFFDKVLGCLVLAIFGIIIGYVWIATFGFTRIGEFGMLWLRPEAIFLVYLYLVLSFSAIFVCFLDLHIVGGLAVAGWLMFLPVIWNVLAPMFVAFLTVVGLFYAPWLPIANSPFGNLLVNGFVIFPEPINFMLLILSYALLSFGTLVYVFSLAQLLLFKSRNNSVLRSGFYSFCRHPQYLGIILWTFGLALIGGRFMNYPAWLTLVYVYLVLAEVEEERLERRLGGKYFAYEKYVPMIVPKQVSLLIKPKVVLKSRRERILAYTLGYVLLLFFMTWFLSQFVYLLRTF